jgi:hypothetical protein
MDDENDNPSPRTYPMSPAKMSKTPSWIMLGFVLGALAAAAFLRQPQKPAVVPAAPPVAITPPEPEKPRFPQPLSKIETVFEMFGKEAVWDRHETTEVGLFDSETNRFADFYEIRRMEGKLYFRTIPELTRRVFVPEKADPANPLQFTETEEQFNERMERWRRANPLGEAFVKRTQPPPPTPKLPAPGLPANSSVRAPSAVPPIDPLPRPAPGGDK